MHRRDLFYLLAALTLPQQTIWAKTFSNDQRVIDYIDYLQKVHAFSSDELHAFFARFTYNEKVLRLVGVPATDAPDQAPPKKIYWQQYRKQRLTARKIVRGINFYKQNKTQLLTTEEKYGVPASVIVAIIGIETNYGKHTGTYSVAQTLATLAFGHPQRGDEFLNELTEFLLYTREARIDPISVTGSYAGAIGMAQFMPSSLRKYAVDYHAGDHINLFSADDAIASIANFLRVHGWRPGKGISYPAYIEESQARQLIQLTSDNDYKATMTLQDFADFNLRTAAPADPDNRYLFVDLENRYDNEYRLGNENFYALTRYNKSFKYAAIVTDLAGEIQRKIN